MEFIPTHPPLRSFGNNRVGRMVVSVIKEKGNQTRMEKKKSS